jgi:hypothetical protein
MAAGHQARCGDHLVNATMATWMHVARGSREPFESLGSPATSEIGAKADMGYLGQASRGLTRNGNDGSIRRENLNASVVVMKSTQDGV